MSIPPSATCSHSRERQVPAPNRRQRLREPGPGGGLDRLRAQRRVSGGRRHVRPPGRQRPDRKCRSPTASPGTTWVGASRFRARGRWRQRFSTRRIKATPTGTRRVGPRPGLSGGCRKWSSGSSPPCAHTDPRQHASRTRLVRAQRAAFRQLRADLARAVDANLDLVRRAFDLYAGAVDRLLGTEPAASRWRQRSHLKLPPVLPGSPGDVDPLDPQHHARRHRRRCGSMPPTSSAIAGQPSRRMHSSSILPRSTSPLPNSSVADRGQFGDRSRPSPLVGTGATCSSPTCRRST